MTSIVHRTARRARLVGLAAGAALLASLPLGVTAAVAGPTSTPAAEQAARPARTVDVMTRNLYLGAELGPVLRALATGNPNAIVGAATQTWAAVQATRPQERLAAIADEIVAADPAVVGLQEVTTWTTFSYNPLTGAATDPVVAYDFLELLLAELEARGADYEAVTGATSVNFSSPPIPVLASPQAQLPTQAIRLADRDVILRRGDVATSNPRNGTFDTIVSFPLGDATLPVPRGWGSVDVRSEKATFRFVNSHLEAFGVPGVDAEAVRVEQVGELLEAQGAIAAEAGALPTVYVGDYNSDAPDAPAYSRLVAAVGRDAWSVARGGTGNTCCFDPTVTDPDEPLTSRIDLVVLSDGIKAPRTEVVGEEQADRTASGLWPSDHAGVVARVVVPASGR